MTASCRKDFVYFAKICFKNFGDRVKYWTTINEPGLFADMAYIRGKYPPGHCSKPFGNCSSGNSNIEPLIAMHNMLLSHAMAVDIYRKHFQVILLLWSFILLLLLFTFLGRGGAGGVPIGECWVRLIFIQMHVVGFIGIIANAFMYEPLTDEESDQHAVNRALAFNLAW